MDIQRVEQRRFTKGDCGVACVAMITGKRYEEVERRFHKRGLVSNGEYFTFHKDLMDVLESFGYEVKRRKFVSWKTVCFPAIVKVNVRAGNYWHWVVLAGDRKILDPKPGMPKVVNHYRGRKGEGQYLYVVQS
ncbi:cysteine peptidase family C39 domain-containing protein [Acidihalobacter prosperus]|uniref:cysteine peptidase family C39 domain-containing protein n=1 Tax=Acidihalobacter prosperus TaxID=160660 RepID=UPI000504A5A9